MTRKEAPPDPSSPQSERADGGGVTRKRRSANHGKPWDCKAMGTKVSFQNAHDAMLARLLEVMATRSERAVTQSQGTKVHFCTMSAQPPDSFASEQ